MQVFNRIEDFIPSHKPVILTIGNFDGVHKGHLSILQHMKEIAEQNGGSLAVLTFSAHPSSFLRPHNPTPLLCTLAHKIKLFEQCGIDSILLLSFDQQLASYSAEAFTEKLRTYIPFSHLILGHDATLGKNRQGDRQTMQSLAHKWNFTVEYRHEYCHEELPVSSTRLRQYLQKGYLDQVRQLLGRPYSIYSKILSGLGQGKQLGFPTANLDVSQLCCPPFGVYAVTIQKEQSSLTGIANLGLAPTIKSSGSPLLEVHLFASEENLYNQEIEVVFHQFIRPEQKFDSINDLKQQIQIDIQKVKKYFLTQVWNY